MLTIGGMLGLGGVFGGGSGQALQNSQSSQSILAMQQTIAKMSTQQAHYAQAVQHQKSMLEVGDVVHVPDEGFKVLEMLEYVQDNTPYQNYSAPLSGSTTVGGYYNPYAQPTGYQTLVNTTTSTTTIAGSIYPSSSAGRVVFADPAQNTYTTYQYANWSNLEIPEEDGEWFELVSQKEAHNADVGVMISLKSGRLIENVYLGGLTKDKFMTEVKEAVKEDK